MMYGIATEPDLKSSIWNGHGLVTTMTMAMADAEISVIWFLLCVVAKRYILQQLWLNNTSHIEEVNRKCRPRNTTVQLSTPFTDPEHHNAQRYR